MRFPSNGQASQINDVAKIVPGTTNPVGPLADKEGESVMPPQIEGDMAAATGRETIGRIPMDRAGSAEDRDPPLRQDKRDNRTKDRVAAVIGERDGTITATQRSRHCWTLISTEPTDALA